MKNIMPVAVAAPMLLIATSAIANDVSTEQMEITASVEQVCAMADLDAVDFGSIDVNASSGENSLLVTQGRIDSGQRVWASCNYAALMTMEGGPMVNQTQSNTGADSGDFTDEINYRITWRSLDGEFLQSNLRTINGSSVSRVQTGAFHSDSQVNTAFAPEDNTLRPLAGDYTATVTFTLGAV